MSYGVEKQDVVTVNRNEYERLLAAEKKLNALEAAGVDNWEGYDVAMAEMQVPEPTPIAPVETAPESKPEGEVAAS